MKHGPLRTSSLKVSGRPRVSRDAGTHRSTLAGWSVPKTYHAGAQAQERALIQSRAEDLYVNDWAARSVINALVTNVIGTGLTPQVRLPWRKLGITQEEARAVGSEMEWHWAEWCKTCHPKKQLSFGELQRLGFRSVLRDGEMLHVPVMEKPEACRRFALQMQEIAPARLATPLDKKNDASIRDGVELTPSGRPVAYWIATPEPRAEAAGMATPNISSLRSASFTRICG
ncbi:phage portal protein [Oleidesulfovibrio sp.]|uniref:phage portal protein n=1 Tax=Oleidesulfovibrio sp. TaxID=2909707 RepID=UPI003A88D270